MDIYVLVAVLSLRDEPPEAQEVKPQFIYYDYAKCLREAQRLETRLPPEVSIFFVSRTGPLLDRP
jgi:hypothetical protein